jgi:hypothetical protein
MPIQSKAQMRAMHTAKEGKSTLGIPKDVGAEFVSSGKAKENLPERKKYDEGGPVKSYKTPPSLGTREAGIKALKSKMPPPGYREGGAGEAAGEPGENIPGGNVGGTKSLGKSYLSDRDNVARPPAPPPYLSPNVPSSVQKDIPNVAKTFKSSQDKPGYNEEGNKYDPHTNPSGFLTGDEYRAIPPSVPAPVRSYIGSNPTTGVKKGGPMTKKYNAGGSVESELPHDTAKSGIDERLKALPKTPRYEEDKAKISKQAEKDLGPNIVSRPEDYTPPPDTSAHAKGGIVKKYEKGGEVCPSNKKQMKVNLIETAVNPTERMALAKGGSVSKPSWRRW